MDDGTVLEINRLCTDGTRNACSMLYGACCRIAKSMGYRKIITYILSSETGSSLKASNFTAILWIVNHHEIGDPVKPKTIRKWLNETGKENVLCLLVLRYADIMGQSVYQKEEKLGIVVTNIDTLSAVLKEEGESDDAVVALKDLLKKEK